MLLKAEWLFAGIATPTTEIGLFSSVVQMLNFSTMIKKGKSDGLFLEIWFLSVLFHQVPLKIGQLFAWEIAMSTNVGMFSSVIAFVHFQITCTIAWIVALVTLERFFTWMGPHVSFEIYSLPRGEFTLSAIERLFFRMWSYVAPEVTASFAGEFTLKAPERIDFLQSESACEFGGY